jgi:hypothetical protein
MAARFVHSDAKQKFAQYSVCCEAFFMCSFDNARIYPQADFVIAGTFSTRERPGVASSTSGRFPDWP